MMQKLLFGFLFICIIFNFLISKINAQTDNLNSRNSLSTSFNSNTSNIVTFYPTDDAFVRSNRPTKIYGQTYELRVRKTSSAENITYLKFSVIGVQDEIQRAILKLYVIDGSSKGGDVYLVSNNYSGTSLPWDENNFYFTNAPDVAGSSLSTQGAVNYGEIVELDVTNAISGDGIYSFALKSDTGDLANYSSKEGEKRPELVIETIGSPSLSPGITSFTPTGGIAGSEVIVKGVNFTGVNNVSFNGTSASNFSVDFSTQLRVTVPFGATSGKIRMITGEGTGTSAEDFIVVYPPTISSFVPAEGPPGTEVTLTGSNLAQIAEVSFNGTLTSNFVIDSSTQFRAVVPSGAASGKISVSNLAGAGVSDGDFTVKSAPAAMTFTPKEDAFVRSNYSTNNYGQSYELRVRRTSSAEFTSYLKFEVIGLSDAVKRATLKLYVIDGSNEGGAVYSVSNNYQGANTVWDEDDLIFDNAPVITGSSLSSQGTVNFGEVVEFDVTSAIGGDGVYSFALKSNSTDAVKYSSKDGERSPELVIETNGSPSLSPEITSLSPTSGIVGSEVIVKGVNFIGVTKVFFNGTAASGFVVDSSTQLRATVPPGATSGKISVITVEGTGTGAEDFIVVYPPTISSFFPAEGYLGTEVTLNGTNFIQITEISFNGIPAASFILDSPAQLRAVVPSGAASGRISVSNLAGKGVSDGDFTVQSAPTTVTFTPTEDAYVRSARPSNNYGSKTYLRVRKPHSEEVNSYLKFEVPGFAGTVQHAIIRLYVTNSSEDGGSIYLVSNSLKKSSVSWNEDNLLYANAPEVTSNPLSSFDAVNVGDVLEFDVTAAINGPGVYSFALRNNANDLVDYSSKEGEKAPELMIETNGSPSLSPDITSLTPTSGITGSEVIVKGINFTGVNNVSFNGTSASNFSVDSSTQLRVTVPFGATSGKISVITGEGTGTSAEDFIVVYPPTISSFVPTEGPPGTEVTLTGSNLAQIAEVSFNGTLTSNFVIDSSTQFRAVVPSGAASGKISVSNLAGAGMSDGGFTVQSAPAAMTFTPKEDAFVRSNYSTNNYGHSYELRVRRTSSAEFTSYLKFEVIGLSDAVKRATLKLYVIDGSNEGGAVYSVSNNYQGTNTVWDEDDLIFDNAPVITGGSLSSQGTVNFGEIVEFDVTSAIGGDGVYSFALKSNSTDAAKYSSKDGERSPELVINTGAIFTSSPTITAFTPASGAVGTEVTISGMNFIGSSNGKLNFSGTLRIMPLGNSITQGVHGSTDNAGYRNDLAELLDSQGIDYDFVGSKINGWGFDKDHEGHSGHRADEILAKLNEYLTLNPSDMILLHIGTNDISELQTPESTINEISDILDVIKNFNSEIFTLLSTVIPRTDAKNVKTNILNNYIHDLFTNKKSAGYNIFYAGNNESFKANPNWESEYMDDRVHPNDMGYAIMAGVWYDGIVNVLSSSDNLMAAFNGTGASNTSIDSPTQIRAVVPPGASTGRISITNFVGTGFSETDFIVTGPAALTLTYPKGGEEWNAGSTHVLAWKSAETIDYLSLDYSLDNGSSWKQISARVINKGKFVWKVPDFISDKCLIRISNADNPGTTMLSLAAFSISKHGQEVIMPNLTELKQAAFDPDEQDPGVIARADLNKDGHIDLFDILNILDSNIEQNNLAGVAKKSKNNYDENTMVKVSVAEAKILSKDSVLVPIIVESNEPIRGFQIKLKYDSSSFKFSKPILKQNKYNMMISSHITSNTIEIMGYLKKENSAFDVTEELIELIGHLKPAFNDHSTFQITKALFASKDNRPLKTQFEEDSSDISNLPQEFQLFQNYPNPFNMTTRIKFNLPYKTQVSLQIYNLKGQLVRTLLNEERKPGLYKINWDGKSSLGLDVTSGIYVYRLKAGNMEDSGLMILLK